MMNADAVLRQVVITDVMSKARQQATQTPDDKLLQTFETFRLAPQRRDEFICASGIDSAT